MKRISVKAKVTAWIALFVILIAGIALAVILQFVSKTIWTEAENVLREAVEDFEEEIEILPNGGYIIDEDSYHEDQVIFSIYNNEGALLSGSVPSLFPVNTILKNGIVQRIHSEGKMYLTYDVAIDCGDNEYLWLRGILYTSLISGVEKRIILMVSVILPILIIVAIAGGYFITKKAFDPIDEICRTAVEIADKGDLSRRVEIKKSGKEFQKLAQFFNKMLDSVEKTFEKEKQFTADASHELRTPISVILSQSEYGLLTDIEDDERKETLEVVNSQAKKMSAIISQMLIMARNEKSKKILEKVDVGESILNVIEDLNKKALEKNILINLDVEDDVFIRSERMDIIRIFTNLIENAISYGKLNGHIWIRLYKENKFIKCAVKDDGIGIAPENHEKVFYRFYRVDKVRTAGHETHTGLGLSMVKMLVENYNGTIHVKSELGKGTEFIMTFPQVFDEK